MKILTISLFFLTFGAQASLNDFECNFNTIDGARVLVEVERSRLSSKRVEVTVDSEDGIERFQYFTMARFDRARMQLELFGGGINLDIDMWPDARPRFGRNYRSRFNAYDVDNGRYHSIYCRYTGF